MKIYDYIPTDRLKLCKLDRVDISLDKAIIPSLCTLFALQSLTSVFIVMIY